MNREYDAVLAHPGLTVEEGPAITEHVNDRHNRHGHSEGHHPYHGDHEVQEPLAPRVGRSVNLIDVEQERYALELRDRQLAQPDVVEERERSDPHPLRVQLCGLGDDLFALLRLTVEYEEVRVGGLHELFQRPGFVRRWHHVVGLGQRDQLSWSLRVFRGVADQAFRLLTLNDRDHSILVHAPALSRTGQSGDEHEDRHQDRRADEDDEARKKLSAREQLKHRDDDVGSRKCNKRPGEATRPVTGRIRQPGRVAGRPR